MSVVKVSSTAQNDGCMDAQNDGYLGFLKRICSVTPFSKYFFLCDAVNGWPRARGVNA